MIETRDLGLLDETEIVVRAAQYNGVSHEVGLHCGNFEQILETADLPRLGDESRMELLSRLDDLDSFVRWRRSSPLCRRQWRIRGFSARNTTRISERTSLRGC
jgi:hypothetical protein